MSCFQADWWVRCALCSHVTYLDTHTYNTKAKAARAVGYSLRKQVGWICEKCRSDVAKEE
jgi:uncharacterized protein YlaI